MKTISTLLLVTVAILSFTGCEETYLTSHPDKGGVILATDWPDATAATLPATFRARVISSASGNIQDFDNLQGAANSLVVEPGEAMVYVFNKAADINVSGSRAKVVESDGGGISSEPGLFYSWAGKISTEKDRDLNLTAIMKRRTGELKLSLAIKPASMIAEVRQVKAWLEGVRSELDMEADELSATSFISATLARSSWYASANLRLLGFDTSARQNLRLEIELANGSKLNAASDVTPYLAGFNDAKNTLQTLSGTLYVSESSATAGNWKRNMPDAYLSVSPAGITLPHNPSEGSATVTTDQSLWTYSIVNAGDWLTLTQTGNLLAIHAAENTAREERNATIHVHTGGGLSDSIAVTQEAAPESSRYYEDREVVKLQGATVGNGVNLVLMGDGYTLRDMVAGSGKYERDMRTAVDYFFSVYPLSAYRDYFTIYMVAAISSEEGISIRSPRTEVDTKFKTLWEGGSSTGIECDYNQVADYVDAIGELANTDIHDITVILPINKSIYAGTCSMFYPTPRNRYGQGFSIALCPVGNYFKEVVVHESGGHGFAKLADEYVYNGKETFPEDTRSEYIDYKSRYEWLENVDFSPDIYQTTWSGFGGNPKYGMVGTFEGADSYGKGIWRPEQNSCMNDNVFYFNAPSRWAQVRRVMYLAGFDYSFAQFLRDDIVPAYPAQMRSSVERFVPFAPPVTGAEIANRKVGGKKK